MAKLGVNLDDVAPDAGGGALPPGRYQFHTIEEKLKANAKGTGEVLLLTYEVLQSQDGKHVGRRVWVNMNVTNESVKAQAIGQGQLKALCKAIGVEGVDDTEELLWREFFADTRVKVEDGREKAEIKKYLFGDDLNPPDEKAAATPPSRPAGGAGSAVHAAAPARPAAGRPSGGNPLPWGDRNKGGRSAPAANRSADLDDDIPF